MVLHPRSAVKNDYPFLAHPPPLKGRTTKPLPSGSNTPRCRSSTFSAIATWAAHVQPGSPASISPRSPSPRKGRRPSITSVYASTQFLHITPAPTTALLASPSICDFKADLTAVGYTSVFLQLPNTPISATLSLSVKPVPPVPFPTRKSRGLTRFRSLSALRRGRSKFIRLDSPTKMTAKAAATSAAIVKRKKSKYAMRPPPLANELALMQFVDGGSMDDNIKRFMEAQAKASGTAGFADVYRDGKGGIWWDQDEELEYTHLLAEGDDSRPRNTLQWVTFGNNTPASSPCVPEDERRGSVSSQDSDLDPQYIVQPVNLLDGSDPAMSDNVVSAYQPGMPVLSIPSRPRHTAKHLRKPDFLVDVAFSRLRTTPDSPISSGARMGSIKPKGKARRRPAPLKLSPPSLAFQLPMNSPIDPDKVRQDFIEASFEPAPVSAKPSTAVPATTPVGGHMQPARSGRAINLPLRSASHGFGSKNKSFMPNMMGFFRSGRKPEAVH